MLAAAIFAIFSWVCQEALPCQGTVMGVYINLMHCRQTVYPPGRQLPGYKDFTHSYSPFQSP
jgi:hypothetical protein